MSYIIDKLKLNIDYKIQKDKYDIILNYQDQYFNNDST